MDAREAFKRLYETIAVLRGPEGCPWDREQCPRSLRGNLIEETYECIEAIDSGGDTGHVKEELGDIFLLVTMISYMYEEEGVFSVAGVLESLVEKLVRRHPHVFGGQAVKDSAEVLRNWAEIKVNQEGREPKDSVLDEVSKGMPPLDRAWKLQKKAAKAGFDWPDARGAAAKVVEELSEVEDLAGKPGREEELEGELGDLLFSAVNLCRFWGVEPSVALQRANGKFVDRFKYVEKRMKESGKEMKGENLSLMDGFWNEAKGFAR